MGFLLQSALYNMKHLHLCTVQDAAHKGALASPAALALNAGTLLASLVHMAVEVPMLLSERGESCHCLRREQQHWI